MLKDILDPEQERLLEEERAALRRAQAVLVGCEARSEDLEALERSVSQLDHLFLIVVVGEFNSGKSTFVNALLGRELLEQGVTPTTTRIQRLSWGETDERSTGEHGIQEIRAPLELLRRLEIVDTPGTNALERDHEAVTQRFVPRSDLVLFVTSADRPFSESERAFLESIRQWGKKIVVVLNKIDILRSDGERDQIERFIREKALALLDFEPEIFGVSAEKALAAKLAGGRSDLAAASRMEPLEKYLLAVLDDVERVRLKLSNPLGVGRRLTGEVLQALESRQELLHDDFSALEDIDSRLGLYEEDMGREFRFRLSDVDHELQELELRGNRFFDDTFRLARAIDLMNRERIQADFRKRVIADSPRRIEARIDDVIDWMIAGELTQWKAVQERLEARLDQHGDRMIGRLGSFAYDREQLLRTVGRAAGAAIEGFDQTAQAERLADAVRNAVAGTAVVEVGALGLGAVIATMATTQLVDFTGLLAAGTLAVLGLFIMPARKRKAKAELAARVRELRDQLLSTLTREFDREIERSVHRIQEAVAPYTRFVRAERRKLAEQEESLRETAATLEALQRSVDSL